jgi:hypothetical protein
VKEEEMAAIRGYKPGLRNLADVVSKNIFYSAGVFVFFWPNSHI